MARRAILRSIKPKRKVKSVEDAPAVDEAEAEAQPAPEAEEASVVQVEEVAEENPPAAPAKRRKVPKVSTCIGFSPPTCDLRCVLSRPISSQSSTMACFRQ